MKISIFEVSQQEKIYFENSFLEEKGVLLYCSPEKLKIENLADFKDSEVLCVFLYSQINKAVIDALPNLKLIATRSTGYDHIDTKYAKEKNILVCNVPSYGSRTVAEFTFGLILGLSRKIYSALQQIKNESNFSYENFQGFNLQGKILGIVGTGKIGQNVANLANAFDMKVLAYDAFPNLEKAKELNFTYTTLQNLFNSSDIISLHVPYNKDTYHLINKKNILQIKPGALLINTARGEIVETEALISALNSGQISGAGLDVLEKEKLLSEEWEQVNKDNTAVKDLKVLLENHILINHPRVLITPHIAFFTKEAKEEILQTTVGNILNFKNHFPKNSVI